MEEEGGKTEEGKIIRMSECETEQYKKKRKERKGECQRKRRRK